MKTTHYDLSKPAEAFRAAMELEDDNCCFAVMVSHQGQIHIKARHPAVEVNADGARKLAAAFLEAADLAEKREADHAT